MQQGLFHLLQVISVGTGVLGMLGNKGAVAVRLRLYDSSLCIVNSHLSSGAWALTCPALAVARSDCCRLLCLLLIHGLVDFCDNGCC